jgi:hypothetical protein
MIDQQDRVVELVDQIILAGCEIAYAHTALSLAVASAIIATAKDGAERKQMHVGQVQQLTQREWVDYIRAHIKPISPAPKRRQ